MVRTSYEACGLCQRGTLPLSASATGCCDRACPTPNRRHLAPVNHRASSVSRHRIEARSSSCVSSLWLMVICTERVQSRFGLDDRTICHCRMRPTETLRQISSRFTRPKQIAAWSGASSLHFIWLRYQASSGASRTCQPTGPFGPLENQGRGGPR